MQPSAAAVHDPLPPTCTADLPSRTWFPSKIHGSPRPESLSSAELEDVLVPGDRIGPGLTLQGELVRRVSTGSTPRASLDDPAQLPPAAEFEVVRRLGTGSYAVVYLVREILSRASSARSSVESGVLGSMDLDGLSHSSRARSTVYGREFAIKCLSKANLDDEQLAAQLSEVKIHQSLHSHTNIVTLHRTLETPSFLLLVLEYVPGEDLFYFLEQARDHYDSSQSPPSTSVDAPLDGSASSANSNTPPTPSLLSTLHPSQLLSRTRLRLVASMFSQMCDAVAACHHQHVYHRDIKPENFIVTDGHCYRSDGTRERKVLVKLTDFGLSTTDEESGDMDCGSAPYMSYECRNNVSPTYRPDAADVWSLGIVLINMLYHHNPWADTLHGACSSFDLFRSNPVQFFMTRFGGMTRPVAEHLANKVFCIRDNDLSPGADRESASEFGAWARDLPDLLAMPTPDTPAFRRTHQRVVSTASSIDHPVSSHSQVSHRPCSRNASINAVARAAAIRSRSLSRAPSLCPAFETSEACELSTVIDQDVEEEASGYVEEPQEIEMPQDGDTADNSASNSRSTSQQRRRKRGARKGKGSSSTGAPSPITPKDETLEVLAMASQSLAREISRQSKASSHHSYNSSASKSSSARRRAKEPFEPPSFFPVPTSMLGASPMAPPPLPALTMPKSNIVSAKSAPASPVVPTKKPSKWKLSFGKSSGNGILNTSASSRQPPEDSSPPLTPPSAFILQDGSDDVLGSGRMSATASNVTNLIMGLDAPPPAPKSAPSDGSWTRGRRNRGSPGPPGSNGSQSHSRSRGRYTSSAFGVADVPVPPLPDNARSLMKNSNVSSSSFERGRSERGHSPSSTRSGGRLASSASSMASGNWRSSMSTTSSAYTSSSAFTRYSNGSSRSVSTAATSVSGHSWRKDSVSSNNSRYHPGIPGNVPRNIKIMNGVPNELVEVPRGQFPGFGTNDFNSGSAAQRKQRTRRPKDLQLELDTITERPGLNGSRSSREKAVQGGMQDASTSTTDLGGDGKAHKGQINTLAKMLSALSRR